MIYWATERPFGRIAAPEPHHAPHWTTALGEEATELLDGLTWLATRAVGAPAAVVLLGSDAASFATPRQSFTGPAAITLRSPVLGRTLGCLCVDVPSSGTWTAMDREALDVLVDLFVAEVENRIRLQTADPASPADRAAPADRLWSPGEPPRDEGGAPIHRDRTGRAEPVSGERISGGRERRPGTILLVEDDAAVRKLVLRVLEKAGYRVLSAATAEDGRRLAEAHEGPLDLLLTDVLLPGMNGPELARELAETRPGLRIIFMSGYVGEAFEEGEMERAEAFIPKPFAPRSILEAVKRALDIR